jgi:putative MATE family efflux protein
MPKRDFESKNMLNMTEGKIFRQLLFFAIPMLIGNLFQQLYNVVDGLVVGNFVGTGALAAVSVSFPVFFMLLAFTIGLSIGATVVVAQYYGSGDETNLRKAVGTTYIITIWIAIIATAVGVFLVDPILQLMQAPVEIRGMASIYMHTVFAGMIFISGYNVIAGILRGVGDSKTPLYFLIMSTVVNTVLVLVFVLVFDWGVFGVGVATLIAEAVSCVACLLYVAKISPLLAFNRQNLHFDKEMARKVLRIGLPAAVQQVAIALCIFITQVLVNGFGEQVIAGYGLAIRIDTLCILFFISIGTAMAAFSGQNVGAGNFERVKQGTKVGTIMILIIAAVLSSLLYFGRFWLLGFFTPDTAVIDAGAYMFFIIAPFYFTLGLTIIYSNVVQGAGAAVPAMIIIIIAECARLPIAFILVDKYGSVGGVWWSFVISWVAGAIIAILYYKFGKWKDKSLVKHRNFPPPEIST